MEHLKLILILKNGICGIYLKWFNANGGIHTGYLISFIQIQPVQNH
jgi:hypothetical protein